MMEIARQTLLLNGNIGIKDAALLWGVDDDRMTESPMSYIFRPDKKYNFESQWDEFTSIDMIDENGNTIALVSEEYGHLESRVHKAWVVAHVVFGVLNSEGRVRVSLEELKELAEIRHERPKFLFPESVATTAPQDSELADLPEHIKNNLKEFIDLTRQAHVIREGLNHGKEWKKEPLLKAFREKAQVTDEYAKVLYTITKPF